MRKLRTIAPILLLAVVFAASGFSGCGTPKPVNPNPTPLDTPVEIANGIVSSTRTFEGIVKRHHNLKRAALQADYDKIAAAPTPGRAAALAAAKAALVDETAKFKKFNDLYKQILNYSEDAAKALQSADSGALATAQGKIKLASDIVVNELLTALVDDPELRDSLTALEGLMQKLIARNTGGQ